MRGLAVATFKRILGIGDSDITPKGDAAAEKAQQSLEALEESQTKLRETLADSGFFLGDALIVKRPRHEPTRAQYHAR